MQLSMHKQAAVPQKRAEAAPGERACARSDGENAVKLLPERVAIGRLRAKKSPTTKSGRGRYFVVGVEAHRSECAGEKKGYAMNFERPLRIAQIAPLCEAVPPQRYGGTERVVAHLTDALVDLGHDVTLFASGDACTNAKLVAMRDTALRLDPNPLKSEVAAHFCLMHEVRKQRHDFDILHFHTDILHFPFFED